MVEEILVGDSFDMKMHLYRSLLCDAWLEKVDGRMQLLHIEHVPISLSSVKINKERNLELCSFNSLP